MSTAGMRTIEPMVGVVVVSHEQVAFSLIEAARRVVGTIPNIAAACVSAGEDSASVLHKVAQACGQVDDGAGVILLVDVFGSTPFNVAMTMADGTRSAEVVCGVNLPMLLETLIKRMRGVGLVDLVDVAEQGGSSGIRTYHEALARISSAEADADDDESF